jgi:hypothetical protein
MSVSCPRSGELRANIGFKRLNPQLAANDIYYRDRSMMSGCLTLVVSTDRHHARCWATSAAGMATVMGACQPPELPRIRLLTRRSSAAYLCTKPQAESSQ